MSIKDKNYSYHAQSSDTTSTRLSKFNLQKHLKTERENEMKVNMTFQDLMIDLNISLFRFFQKTIMVDKISEHFKDLI